MHSIISIFCHDLLLILSFFVSTWPLTFNLWHLFFKKLIEDTALFHQEIIEWNMKVHLLQAQHTRKTAHDASPIPTRKHSLSPHLQGECTDYMGLPIVTSWATS